MSRSYLVGLPVVITVDDDGSIIYEVDTAEAGVAVRDEWRQWSYTEVDEAQLLADVALIDDDHRRRNGGY